MGGVACRQRHIVGNEENSHVIVPVQFDQAVEEGVRRR